MSRYFSLFKCLNALEYNILHKYETFTQREYIAVIFLCSKNTTLFVRLNSTKCKKRHEENTSKFLPPAYVVRQEVMFSQVCVFSTLGGGGGTPGI